MHHLFQEKNGPICFANGKFETLKGCWCNECKLVRIPIVGLWSTYIFKRRCKVCREAWTALCILPWGQFFMLPAHPEPLWGLPKKMQGGEDTWEPLCSPKRCDACERKRKELDMTENSWWYTWDAIKAQRIFKGECPQSCHWIHHVWWPGMWGDAVNNSHWRGNGRVLPWQTRPYLELPCINVPKCAQGRSAFA